MSFIRKIKKGKYTYLAEVENKWVDGKVIQKHIRYVGRELNGKVIKSGSLENTEVTKVTTWAPLLVLDTLAKQIDLSGLLGKQGDYLLSLAYAHCLEPKCVNKMEDWYSRTDLHNMLNISEVSEKKLYNALDSIPEEKYELIQKNIFNAVSEKFKLKPKGYFFDVTNVYFFGTECDIAKKGKNKEGRNKPQVQIGLAVTENEGIPIFHKTFEGNIYDARIMKDMVTTFNDFNIENLFLVWDRGVSSESNILDAKKAGFDVICGLSNKGSLSKTVDTLKKDIKINLKNRIRLKNTIMYCTKSKYNYGEAKGCIVLCYNEEQARLNREKRVDLIFNAKEQLQKGKPISDKIKKYFSNGEIDETVLEEAQKNDGYSILFSTKDLPIEKIVKPYFEKDMVEKAFRSLKSILGLRPIKHWIAERVKAHIFICYLSYLLISVLDSKLKNKGITAIYALDKLKTAYKVNLKNKKLKKEFSKTVTLTKEQEIIMKVVDKNILKPSV